ncbi:hypothetical protein CLV56_0810 [Mumia flava]|uniref:Uncharacterized protein n=1 Tax=Mumia flava TaxID=1348852 RepID=A0A0B2BJZ7_9ACTN|nr:DUF6069 family protein [Mumia flava]PJJ56601.1 hypothetical protein CLV56_0810 [Mumia flava]
MSTNRDVVITPAAGQAAAWSWGRVAGLGLVAVLVNLLLLAVGHALGADYDVGQEVPVRVEHLLAGTLVPFVLASTLLWLLTRNHAPRRRPLARVGLGLGVLSALAPALSAESAESALFLAAMHVVTAALWYVAVAPRPRV